MLYYASSPFHDASSGAVEFILKKVSEILKKRRGTRTPKNLKIFDYILWYTRRRGLKTDTDLESSCGNMLPTKKNSA